METGLKKYIQISTGQVVSLFGSSLTSSMMLARKCSTDVAYMYLAAIQQPDIRTICKFRVRHMKRIPALFAQIVNIYQGLGLVGMAYVAICRTWIKANASSANLYDLQESLTYQKDLEDKIRKRLEEMAIKDKEEDELYDQDQSGYEMSKEIRDLQTHKHKIDQLIKKLKTKQSDKKINLTDSDAVIQNAEFG